MTHGNNCLGISGLGKDTAAVGRQSWQAVVFGLTSATAIPLELVQVWVLVVSLSLVVLEVGCLGISGKQGNQQKERKD